MEITSYESHGFTKKEVQKVSNCNKRRGRSASFHGMADIASFFFVWERICWFMVLQAAVVAYCRQSVPGSFQVVPTKVQVVRLYGSK